MSELIHPTAIIHPEAKIAPEVSIGPYCTVGPRVEIGSGTKLMSHVVVCGPTKMGQNNTIHPFARIGGEPQDLKFQGEEVRLEVGDNNTFRECVTINRGTGSGGGLTKIGNHNLFMAYSHAAHDDIIGNYNVIANSTQLAGHVEVGDYVVIGGACAIQQFVRLGDYSYIGGATSLIKDIPPYCIAYGNRGRVTGVNVIGLKRKGFEKEDIFRISEAQRTYFKQRMRPDEALDKCSEIAKENKSVKVFVDFIASSKVALHHVVILGMRNNSCPFARR